MINQQRGVKWFHNMLIKIRKECMVWTT